MNHSAVRIIAEPVNFSPSTGAVIQVASRHREPAILDSAAAHPIHGRYTIVACEPVATFSHRPQHGDPFQAMRGLLRTTGMLAPADRPADLPFAGGWIGYFAYEAGRYLERLPATTVADVGLPLARFSLYDSAVIHDHLTGRWTVAAADFRSRTTDPWTTVYPSPDPLHRVAWWKDLLANASACEPSVSPSPPPYRPISCNLTREQHLQAVQRAREYIAAGDIFQVNFARRESTAAIEPPIELYLRLRQSNPGAYSAFLCWNDAGTPPVGNRCHIRGLASPEPDGAPAECPHGHPRAILSSSPELFLDLNRRQAVTRPIKGTRPRSADPSVDESLRRALVLSVKDRAELAMIVDLERNDLGRVCEFGSLRVIPGVNDAAPFSLESHPTVHHLVAEVAGCLAEGRDAIHLLRATFPGGSITGAPKVRAMEIIDELEPNERSVYTGSIGYFSPGGRMVMNIAIRTLIQAGPNLHWYAGGGIVADSEPVAEYDETRAKALGIRRALGIAESVNESQPTKADSF